MSIIPQDTSRNNPPFKIDPEFRDKLPKLTASEFERLRMNILSAGKVEKPLKVWHGSLEDNGEEHDYLIDGHHRWRVIEEHPELPYTIEYEEFPNKWAAIAWMYKNQKGQRNLSDLWSEKINGEIVKAEIKAEGAPKGNQNAQKQLDQIDPVVLDKPKSTVARVAKELGVPEGTLKKQLEFARGLDAAEDIEPGFQQEVLNGDVKASRASVRRLRLMDPEERKDAINAIRNPPPKPQKPKRDPEAAAKRAAERELKERIHEIAEDMRKTDIAAYTQTDLERDLTLITERAVRDIRQELTIRKKSITDTEALVEILVACERELAEVETELTKGVYAK